jgi:hypothetical protein
MQHDPVWDKTFPKFDAATKGQAIGMYWDYYYETASALADKLPDRFRIFDVGVLNSDAGSTGAAGFLWCDGRGAGF